MVSTFSKAYLQGHLRDKIAVVLYGAGLPGASGLLQPGGPRHEDFLDVEHAEASLWVKIYMCVHICTYIFSGEMRDDKDRS